MWQQWEQPTCNWLNNKMFQPAAMARHQQEQHNAKVPLTAVLQCSSSSIVTAVACYGTRRIRISSNKQQSTSGDSISNQHHNSNAVLIATMLCCTYSFIRESSHHAVTATAIEKSKATIGKKSLEQRQPTNQLAFEWQHRLGNWKGEVAVFVTAVRVLLEWQQSQQKSGDLQRKQDYIYTGAS